MKTISVVGVGRLGLCLALNLEKSGYNVLGIDLDKDYVESLRNKTFRSPEPGVNELLENSRIQFSVLGEEKEKSDFIFIVVPTPSLKEGNYDHSKIRHALDLIKYKDDTDIIINSTVMPGLCNELNEEYKKSKIRISYSPEFIAQGEIILGQLYPDIVLIGEYNVDSGDKVQSIYANLCKNNPPIKRMSTISAEVTKLALNCVLTTKIALANNIGDLAVTSGAEPDKILDAIGSDSRVGKKFFNYGFGFGGPCLSRDNEALSYYASTKYMYHYLNKATVKSNYDHLTFQVNQFEKKNNKNAPVIITDVTYKEGTDIIEESQQLLFALRLKEKFFDVIIKEKKSIIDKIRSQHGNLFKYEVIDP